MLTAVILYFGVYDVGDLLCLALVEDAGNYSSPEEKGQKLASCQTKVVTILSTCVLVLFLVYFPIKIHLGLTLFSYTYERFKIRADVFE
jgi:hypothetical protein